jgi:hypothetical protein
MLSRAALALLLTSGLWGQQGPRSWNSDTWALSKSSHELHLVAGFLVGGAATMVAKGLGYGDPNADTWLKRNTKPWQHGVFWGVTAGWWKENRDNGYPGVRGSWPDFTYTVAGAGVAAGIFVLLDKPKPPSEAYAMAPKLLDEPRFVVTVTFTPSVIFDDRGAIFLLVAPNFAIRL